MALPEHVKQLATDAVAGKPTTDWIRQHSRESVAASLLRELRSGDSGKAKRQALEAVEQSETMRQIRLVAVNEIAAPLPTPRRDALRAGGNAMTEFLWKGNEVAASEDGRERDDGR